MSNKRIILLACCALLGLFVVFLLFFRYSVIPAPGNLGQQGAIYKIDRLTGRTLLILGARAVEITENRKKDSQQEKVGANELAHIALWNTHATLHRYGYIDDWRGTLRNDLPRPIRYVVVKFEVLDAQGTVIHTERVTVMSDRMEPGDTKTFVVNELIEDIPSDFSLRAEVSAAVYSD